MAKIFKNGEIIEVENYQPIKKRKKAQNQDEQDEEVTETVE